MEPHNLHKFRPELAKKYGLAEAVLLYYVEFWVAQNEAKGRTDNFQNGRWWMFNSYTAIAEELGYMSWQQVNRYMNKLVACGALIVDNFNKRGLDRTRWYALGDEVLRFIENEKSIYQIRQMDLSKSKNAFIEIDKAIPIVNPIVNVNSKPNASGARAEGGSPGWRSAIGTLEAVWGLTLTSNVAARIGSLVDDFGEEVFLRAVTKAVRANERKPIIASRVINYIAKTAAGLSQGLDFDNAPLRGNDVAALAERAQRELDKEGSDSGGSINDSSSGDSVWGVWGG